MADWTQPIPPVERCIEGWGTLPYPGGLQTTHPPRPRDGMEGDRQGDQGGRGERLTWRGHGFRRSSSKHTGLAGPS